MVFSAPCLQNGPRPSERNAPMLVRRYPNFMGDSLGTELTKGRRESLGTRSQEIVLPAPQVTKKTPRFTSVDDQDEDKLRDT